jgi:hypothetical protein
MTTTAAMSYLLAAATRQAAAVVAAAAAAILEAAASLRPTAQAGEVWQKCGWICQTTSDDLVGFIVQQLGVARSAWGWDGLYTPCGARLLLLMCISVSSSLGFWDLAAIPSWRNVFLDYGKVQLFCAKL